MLIGTVSPFCPYLSAPLSLIRNIMDMANSVNEDDALYILTSFRVHNFCHSFEKAVKNETLM